MQIENNIKNLKTVLDSLKDAQPLSGYALVSEYQVRETSNKSPYINGQLMLQGQYNFKVWSNAPAFSLFGDQNLVGKIISFQGNTNIYNDRLSIIIKSLQPVDIENEEIDPTIFYIQKYNIYEVWNSLEKFIQRHCSPKVNEFFDYIFSDVDFKNKFMRGFAASTHHDCYVGGLMAHTLKVLRWVPSVIATYHGGIGANCTHDLLYVGALLHDIGKVDEIVNGIYSERSYVSHPLFGVERIVKLQDKILSLWDEDFYYKLIAVVGQHHGEFGERPKIHEAYIIHHIDNLEAKIQTDNQLLEEQGRRAPVKVDEFWLQ